MAACSPWVRRRGITSSDVASRPSGGTAIFSVSSGAEHRRSLTTAQFRTKFARSRCRIVWRDRVGNLERTVTGGLRCQSSPHHDLASCFPIRSCAPEIRSRAVGLRDRIAAEMQIGSALGWAWQQWRRIGSDIEAADVGLVASLCSQSACAPGVCVWDCADLRLR